MRKKTTAEFVVEANILHRNFYTYDKTVYKNNRAKVIITCPIHGDFEQSPNNHLQQTGRGCRQCQYATLASQFATAQNDFIENAGILHKNKYTYGQVVYKNTHTKVVITCPAHGEFTQTPNHHLKGHACSSCQVYNGGFNPLLPGILYYLDINNGQAFKVGITNRSVEERFSITELKSIKVLHLEVFPLGQDAREKETHLLRKYKKYQYIGPDLLYSGNTELFTHNIHKEEENEKIDTTRQQ